MNRISKFPIVLFRWFTDNNRKYRPRIIERFRPFDLRFMAKFMFWLFLIVNITLGTFRATMTSWKRQVENYFFNKFLKWKQISRLTRMFDEHLVNNSLHFNETQSRSKPKSCIFRRKNVSTGEKLTQIKQRINKINRIMCIQLYGYETVLNRQQNGQMFVFS